MTINWNAKEAAAVVALQRGIQYVARPFAVIGDACGMTEAEVLALAQQLMDSGDARRFGSVFDARRLGYRSALCAMQVPRDQLARIGAQVATIPGITHAYERGWPSELPSDSPGAPGTRQWPNLWFTLVDHADQFEGTLATLRTACAPYAIDDLPALRRFKIDVVFDLRTRDRDERVEPRAPIKDAAEQITLSDLQKAIVAHFQGTLPIRPDFFAPLAADLGMTETALLTQLRQWQEQGIIRRTAILLRHREIGFKANGMCCWDVAPEAVLEMGRRVAAFPEVTHCYERPLTDRFPFRLYAMIHTPTWEGTQALYTRITREAGLQPGQLLLSLTEYKKTSMVFF